MSFGRSGVARLLTLVSAFVLAAGASAQDAVRWQRLNGAVASGSALSRVSGAPAFGISAQRIATGQGAVAFVVAEDLSDKVVGLATSPDGSTTSIRFGFLLGSDGSVCVVEDGVAQASIDSYSADDEFSITIGEESVIYRHNGVQVFESTLAPAYPAFVEAILSDTAEIASASIDGQLSELAEWSNAVIAVSAEPGAVVRTLGTGYGGAVSTRAISSGDGVVEFTIDEASGTRVIGLSMGDSDTTAADIDFAISFSSGAFAVLEAGSAVATGAYMTGDAFRISVESGAVLYRKNGLLIHTSSGTPAYPLLIDTAIQKAGTGFSNVSLAGALVDVGARAVTVSPAGGQYSSAQTVVLSSPTSGAAIHYTLDGTEPTASSASVSNGGAISVPQTAWLKAVAIASGLFPSAPTRAWFAINTAATTTLVDWTNLANATTSTPGQITAGVGVPYGGGVSTKAILGGDGYVELAISDDTPLRMIGLSSLDADQSPEDVDFGLLFDNGTAAASLLGEPVGAAAFTTGDVLRIGVEAGIVKYRKNGVVFHTSPVPPTYPLLVDTALHTVGTGFSGVTISGVVADSRTAAPVFTPAGGAYVGNQSVSLQAEPGATIHYTTDGSTPTSASSAYTSVITAPVSPATTVKAFASRPGFLDSAVQSETYTNLPAQAPVLVPGPGSLIGPALVSATSGTSGSVIHYTLNGSDPTAADASVSNGGAISLTSSGVLRAIAVAPGYAASPVTAATYEVVAPSPVISPYGGSFVGGVTVTMSALPTATIRYTLDGSEPDWSSAAYSAPFVLEASATVKARAFVDGWTLSPSTAAVFLVSVATPSINPPSGKWFTRQNVTVTTATAGATIRYTTNGAVPVESDASVPGDGVLTIDRSTILRVKAFKTGLDPSSTVRGLYSVTGAVQAGQVSSVALKADKTVWVWGANYWGQLGRGDATGSQTSPLQVAGLTDIEAVAAGNGHVLALKSDGTLVAWGLNNKGQIGIGNLTNQLSPVAVPGLTGVKAIAAGEEFSMALLTNGEVWTWGVNNVGQLCEGTTAGTRTSPVKSLYPSSPTQIAAGDAISLALYSDGVVKGCGRREALGINWFNSAGERSPVSVLLPSGVTEIFAGRHYGGFAAIKQGSSYQMFGWGGGGTGELGVGLGIPSTGQLVPILLAVGRAIAAPGDMHTVLSGPVLGMSAAGDGSSGQLGLGPNPRSRQWYFAPIAGAPLPVSITAGQSFSEAVSIDGALWTWGSGSNGAAGQGTTAHTYSPTPVAGFLFADNSAMGADSDGDGLADGTELLLGSDPLAADSNGDGIDDRTALTMGQDLNTLDPDGDGLVLEQELLLGTSPTAADTDADGVADGLDAFPLDPTRSTPLSSDPNDHTPPVITLQRPIPAIQIP